MRIDRCYCFDVSFDALHAAAVRDGATSVAELQEGVSFGRKCELCHPYVRRMLRTGETVFSEIVSEDEVESPEAGEPQESAAG